MVYCHVCGASCTKWDTLRKYAQRVHSTDNVEFIVYMHHYINKYIYIYIHVVENEIQSSENKPIMSDELNSMESSDVVEPAGMERELALFLLRASDELSLSHNGFDKVCSSTQWFIDTVAESVSEKVKDYLSGIGVECDGNDIDGMSH